MLKQYRLHELFLKFDKNLRISTTDNIFLRDARKQVRSHLRKNFKEIKFMTQGSYAYGTLNRVSYSPPQRMDLDDGAYFFDSNFTEINPHNLTDELYNIIDGALGKLANEMHWQLDSSKPACSRLIIRDDMHIDVPCYIVCNNLKINLVEDKSIAEHRTRYEAMYREAELTYHPYVSTDSIFLVHKNEGLIKSDPRRIIDWVLACVNIYGKEYLRICRYLKAWRDYQWRKSPLASILVMAMVERVFKDEGTSLLQVDDEEIVFRCVGRMIDYLEDNVCIFDPSDSSKCLNECLCSEEITQITERLKLLYQIMEKVLCDGNLCKEDACRLLREQFGKWFPIDHNLVKPLAVVAPSIVVPTRTNASPSWSK